MPAPIPATDAQLRQLAERGAQRWYDNVLRDFDDQWRTEQAEQELLSSLPAENRDAMSHQLREFIQRWHNQLMTVVDQHRGPIADQAYAVLASRNPRPTDHDLGDVAAADRLADGAVAATPALQEAAARIGDIGERIEAFPEITAGALPQMRAMLETQVAHQREELAERITRTSRIRALIDAHPEHDALLAAIGADLWTAQAAAAEQHTLLTGSEDDFERVLRPIFDGTATDEQQEEFTTVINARLAAVAEASKALGAQLEALAESIVGYFCRPPAQP